MQAVNETTDKLIGQTAENAAHAGRRDPQDGGAARRSTSRRSSRRSSTSRAALEDISRFRQEALPQDGAGDRRARQALGRGRRRRSRTWTTRARSARSRSSSQTWANPPVARDECDITEKLASDCWRCCSRSPRCPPRRRTSSASPGRTTPAGSRGATRSRPASSRSGRRSTASRSSSRW